MVMVAETLFAQQECVGSLALTLQGSTSGQSVNLSGTSAGADQVIACTLETQLQATVPSIGIGSWEKVSGPGNVVFTNALDPLTEIQVNAHGVYELKWVVDEGSCTETDFVLLTFVQDSVPPTIMCPADTMIDINANGQILILNYLEEAIAMDNCSQNPVITQVPAAGSLLDAVAGNSYTVTFTATDQSGNTSQCQMDLTAGFISELQLICPADTIIKTDPCVCVAAFNFAPTISSNRPYGITYSHLPGSDFPVGITTVQVSVFDSVMSDEVQCQFDVEVVDSNRMEVTGNNSLIQNGSLTTQALNNTLFGTSTVGGILEKTFVIRHIGCSAFQLTGNPLIRLTGSDAAKFVVVEQPNIVVLDSCKTISFVVRYSGTEQGMDTATVEIQTSSANEPLYTFNISAVTSDVQALVRGNSTPIPNGSITPKLNDFTDYGAVNFGSTRTRTFRVYNQGTFVSMTLFGSPIIKVTGADANMFEVTLQPNSNVLPNSYRDFSIRFTGSKVGVFNATVYFENSDMVNNPYTFAIRATVLAPNFVVQGNNMTIPNGSVTTSSTNLTDFGNRNINADLTHSFVVRNLAGGGILNLNGNPRVQITGPGASMFTVVTMPTAQLSPGGSTLIRIRFRPTVQGVFFAQVSIPNNNVASSPYTFTVSGSSVVSLLPYADEISSFTSFNSQMAEVNQWNAYPNPTVGKLDVIFDKVYENETLLLYNSFGTLVRTIPFVKGVYYKLDITDLISGVYVLKMEDKQLTPIRIVKID